MHKSINPYCISSADVIYSCAMRTTLDIPDTMYRRIKARSAEEGRTVRSITLVLYSQWLGDSRPEERRGSVRRRRTDKPAWFGSVKVEKSLPHDMDSVRESIARHHGE